MLKLGIPSKGRLMDRTINWFGERGVGISLTGDAREYAGAVAGVEGVSLVLLAAGEIPRELAAGRIHIGVTGTDMVHERLPMWNARVVEIAPLNFGEADLIIAVPDFWSDTTTLDDLDAVATAFRQSHGHRLRIATKYHRLVREFLRKHGVSDYQLVDSQGATEGTVKNLTAEAIADITSTGETLRANHLRPLEDGLVLRSQATLFKSKADVWGDGADKVWVALLSKLGLG